ncbi:MAG: hypothetical protein ACQESR_20525 [Planctomycetota bacterium]
MESGPTQAVLPLVGLAAETVIRDRYNTIWVGDSPFGESSRIRYFGLRALL